MDPQVIAAWIAAAAATVAAVISGFVAWRVSALSGKSRLKLNWLMRHSIISSAGPRSEPQDWQPTCAQIDD
jgi:uncharacterized membrane protein